MRSVINIKPALASMFKVDSMEQNFVNSNGTSFDEAAAFDLWTAHLEMSLSVDPSRPNVQLQPTSALSSNNRMEILFPRFPYDAPHPITQTSYPAFQNIAYPQTVVPHATVASFINSTHETHLSGDGHVQISTAPHPVPQLLLSPPPTRHLVKVPQEIYSVGRGQWNFNHSGLISFSVNGVTGINMRDALGKCFTGLDGRDDLMFQNENVGTAISCRFQFPGYPKNGTTQISTLGWKKERIPITRSKLAYEVAKKLKRYLDSMTGYPMENSADNCWKIGEGSMRFENMHLVSLSAVSKGSFQPEIWVMV